MQFKDYYQILGVARDATADDVKKAFRKLARKYHPDVSKEPDAEARMKELNEANAVLSDPEKRAAYDQYGHAGVDPQAGGGPGGMGGFADAFSVRIQNVTDLPPNLVEILPNLATVLVLVLIALRETVTRSMARARTRAQIRATADEKPATT